MCLFLLAAFPADSDLEELSAAIPEHVRSALLRGGLCDSWPGPEHFQFEAVGSELILPNADELLVRCTRHHL